MKPFAILLIIFWIIVIVFPTIIAYLIWSFFIFIWINILMFFRQITSKKWEQYVKFWDYKIYK